MRKIFIIIAAVWITTSVFAQPPEKISYQAVIRDTGNNLITNQTIGMQISILQGTADGTSVYEEIQTPTTNANGLVSFEIGAGTIVSGSFATIDWANGPYFIKTETDPTGETSYTITGVSQLLSVPYALHAKTAETITGTITETDPVFTESDAANITATDITNLGNLSGTNTGDQDLSAYATKTALSDSIARVRSEIPDVSSFLSTETDLVWDADSSLVRAEVRTEISDSLLALNAALSTVIQDTENQIRADIPTVTTYSVGDFAQGGVVFWVDETGQHGLACAIEDQDGGSSIQWYNGSSTTTSAVGDGVYAGEMNTLLIIANQGATLTNYAAGLCANYSVSQNGVTYGDWYLPSKYELMIMNNHSAAINSAAGDNGGSNLAIGWYWSSTEDSKYDAWMQLFHYDSKNSLSKDRTARVRAVRAF